MSLACVGLTSCNPCDTVLLVGAALHLPVKIWWGPSLRASLSFLENWRQIGLFQKLRSVYNQCIMSYEVGSGECSAVPSRVIIFHWVV